MDTKTILVLKSLSYVLKICNHSMFSTVPGRQGWQKIIPQKNAEKINKYIKYFVEINKNEVNQNCTQKTKGKRVQYS
jgi:signal peptidase I